MSNGCCARVLSNLGANQRDTFELMADIFNNFDRTTETRFLSLDERSKDSAEKIRALMFTLTISSNWTRRADPMRTVEKDKMTMALKGGSDEMRAVLLQHVRTRVQADEGRYDGDGPVRLSEVEQAHWSWFKPPKTSSTAAKS